MGDLKFYDARFTHPPDKPCARHFFIVYNYLGRERSILGQFYPIQNNRMFVCMSVSLSVAQNLADRLADVFLLYSEVSYSKFYYYLGRVPPPSEF